ncbi:MAG: hypothetical protein V7K25_23185 [Nostoc sp.]|uniref:hypothetical protein n=1 Tax=Nostoc sp. TaxID=1180 RepID=UPI002FF52F7A
MKPRKFLKNSLLAVAGLTSLAILNPQIAAATTLVKLSLNQANLEDTSIRIAEICPEFACNPEEVFFANNVNTPIITLLNNTDFTITGFRLKLLDNQDAIFEQTSSELFSNVTLLNNGTETLFTGGVLPINTAATFIIDSGANKVAFSASLNGTPVSVPEPDSVVGIFITLAALGGSSILKNKLEGSIAN